MKSFAFKDMAKVSRISTLFMEKLLGFSMLLKILGDSGGVEKRKPCSWSSFPTPV
jgi:hypothetical protein